MSQKNKKTRNTDTNPTKTDLYRNKGKAVTLSRRVNSSRCLILNLTSKKFRTCLASVKVSHVALKTQKSAMSETYRLKVMAAAKFPFLLKESDLSKDSVRQIFSSSRLRNKSLAQNILQSHPLLSSQRALR